MKASCTAMLDETKDCLCYLMSRRNYLTRMTTRVLKSTFRRVSLLITRKRLNIRTNSGGSAGIVKVTFHKNRLRVQSFR